MFSGAFANVMETNPLFAGPMLNRSFSHGLISMASRISKGKTSRPFASSRMKKIPYEGHRLLFSPSLPPLLTLSLWFSHYLIICIGFFPLFNCWYLFKKKIF
jgi:hypothetical protein